MPSVRLFQIEAKIEPRLTPRRSTAPGEGVDVLVIEPSVFEVTRRFPVAHGTGDLQHAGARDERNPVAGTSLVVGISVARIVKLCQQPLASRGAQLIRLGPVLDPFG